ncbi:integrase [Pseudomonas sp. TMW22090]|uniref:gamma-mobile-trio integrase GmtZ n=1 Tax=Pseudomonas sp. TMW22090 TaxID=2506434 RepID=UPI001F118ED1|nr:VPA1269 family protein [Pseudomonas sp. TMW22090]MCH4881045.1 integrase [Pseudomonas sp. TMW22090]
MVRKNTTLYTYPEAKVAVLALGIEDSRDYRVRRRQDPRLPYAPFKYYAGIGWANWFEFLGKKKPDLYSTYVEAQTAVLALGIKDSPDYKIRHGEDPRLPAMPSTFYAGAGWTDWFDFLGKKKPDLYSTYVDARAAAQELGIKTQSEYYSRYREDPRLPSAPLERYAEVGWTNWFDFLGKKKPDPYATYIDARAAAQELGIKTQSEYTSRYREDPRLPFAPFQCYADVGWTNWFDFLGKNKPDPYATDGDARTAAQELGIKHQTEYTSRYREDPRLPFAPFQCYADVGWTSWLDFLGSNTPNLYPTYAEAQAAVLALGISDSPDYKIRRRQDPRLPGAPFKYYAGVGWTDWFEFLGKTKPDPYSTYVEAQAAAKQLGIKHQIDYINRHRQDPRLPSAPLLCYAGIGWTSWFEFLGGSTYPTYDEAKAAVLALCIKDGRDYKTRRRQDPKLPAVPYQFYANKGWKGWYDFLGNKSFYTFDEAQAAAQRLGIKSGNDYFARYREDPKLPSDPKKIYAHSGWTGWCQFLDKENHTYTYTEAQEVCQALGIKSSVDYTARYREDPKLPGGPHHSYAKSGWTGWYEFLGKEKSPWHTYDEAQLVCQDLGFKTAKEYSAGYREDPRLHSNPEKLYADLGWTDWYTFLGIDKPVDCSSDYPNILADVERWLKSQTAIPNKRTAIKIFLNGYVNPLKLPDNSKFFLLRTNPFSTTVYTQLIESQAPSSKQTTHSSLEGFFQWLLDADCTDEDNDERIVLQEYRNPLSTILAGYSDSLQRDRPSQSTKPPLGYEYILRARNFLVPNSEAALLTRPTLSDLPHLRDFFDSSIDWKNVDESKIDRSDTNCIWRTVQTSELTPDGKRQPIEQYQIWSPARFVALYTLLRFPLRGQQILWLDSGEADSEIAALNADGSIRWEKNTGPIMRRVRKTRRPPQAAVQRGIKDAPRLYVTTNKTGRKAGGYHVDWIPDDLMYWFLLLRDWQAKYNPLTDPTPWTEITLPAETNETILKARGTQCFLFRADASGQPLLTKSVFIHLLPALLYKIQRDGEDLATKSDNKTFRFVSPYTPHSLRVSLITAFIADGDAPIHVISKLVGHSSLVMTIYYTVLNNEQMRVPMGEIEKRAAQKSVERCAEAIRLGGLDALSGKLIATDRNRSLIESDVPSTACVVFDCGICPMSGAGCHIGGDVVVERKAEKYYSPVEAGYLGQKNCPRCRFFITGIPFLGGLVALANEIALEINTESARYQGYTAELDALEQEHYDVCREGKPFLHEMERKRAVSNQQQSAGKLDVLLGDYAALNGHIQSCLKLINEKESDSTGDVRLIVPGDMHDIGIAFQESDSNYHLLAEICQNATIYQSANPSRAIPLIAQAIDRMAENNGLPPAMFRLSDEQKIIVANELNRLLLQRLGSWEKIDDLFSGDLMLLEIDTYEPELTHISSEIRKLLSNPNSARPLRHEVPLYE